MGLDFFRRAIALQEQYRRPGQRNLNALQTNATLLDDAWCEFLGAHDFLLGISLDGPPALHDVYRVDKGGAPTCHHVLNGIALLKKHGVQFNILATVQAANATHPLDVYRFFREEVAVTPRLDDPLFIQFIPIVERQNDTGFQEGDAVTHRSVQGRQYGDFLCAVFDEWVRRDVGRVYVQLFDVALAVWTGERAGLCVFEETCGDALALEHNGDLFSCDHYVEPRHKLGNLAETSLRDMVSAPRQREFGSIKRNALPGYCRVCSVRFICNGGCPKDRLLRTPDGEWGLNYLCEGYKAFFTQVDRPMRTMADFIRQRRPPADIMFSLAREDLELERRFAQASRNDPCPCGSGVKFKRCHGATKAR